MSINKTVRLTKRTLDVLGTTPTAVLDQVNHARAINSLAAAYEAAMLDSMPDLTQAQKMALACCYNGYMPSESIKQELRLLPWHISEGYQYDEQIQQFLGDEEQFQSFLADVKGWSDTQKLAAIYAARLFWASSRQED